MRRKPPPDLPDPQFEANRTMLEVAEIADYAAAAQRFRALVAEAEAYK